MEVSKERAAKKPRKEPASATASGGGTNHSSGISNDDDVKPDSAVSSSSPVHRDDQQTANSREERSTGDACRQAVKQEEPAAEDAKPAARANNEGPERVLVEFKFRSYKTQLFKEGAFKGVLHFEMERDQDSGFYSIPLGETNFRAHLDKVCTESWCMGEVDCQEFSGTFKRTIQGSEMDPGLTLDYFTGNHRNFKATVRPWNVAMKTPCYNEIKEYGSEPFVARALSEWEEHQGGFLVLVASVSTNWVNDVRWGYYGGTYEEKRSANGTYKIKLYTVLSAHRPNEEEDSLPKYSRDQSPDWDALVGIVATRNPDKSDSWARNAVRQYRYFMDLKVDPKFSKHRLSPSCAIDEIWHAHLSFTDRYQRDMVCLTKGNGIVEHMPVHLKQSATYYKKAHSLHLKRMKKLHQPVDDEFWPEPMPYDPSEHENSSDTEKMKGELDSGKPAYTGPKSSTGCGGCG